MADAALLVAQAREDCDAACQLRAVLRLQAEQALETSWRGVPRAAPPPPW